MKDQRAEERRFWARVQARSLHSTQSLALEVLARLGFPISATALHRMTEGQIPLVNCSYHLNCLERDGLLEMVETQPRRGTIEKFYALRLTEDG